MLTVALVCVLVFGLDLTLVTVFTVDTAWSQNSGTLTYAQIEGYWMAAGGPASAASTAAAITGAEASFEPGVIQQQEQYCNWPANSVTGWGLWQITCGNSVPAFGQDFQMLDPWNNAEAAWTKYHNNGNSFAGVWSTYGNGACPGNKYCQFLKTIPPQPVPTTDTGQWSPIGSAPSGTNNTSQVGALYGTAIAQPGAVPVVIQGEPQEDLFAVGAGGHLYEEISEFGQPFGSWFAVPIPGVNVYASPVTVVSPTTGEIDVFGTGSGNNSIWETKYTSGCNCWTSEVNLGGLSYQPPSVVVIQGEPQEDLFVVGGDNSLWESISEFGGLFGNWFKVPIPNGDSYSSGPSVISPASGEVDVFGAGSGSNNVFETKYTAGCNCWTGETNLGGVTYYAPSATVIQGSSQEDLFATGTNNAAWENVSTVDGPFGGWFQIPVPGGDDYVSTGSVVSTSAGTAQDFGTVITGWPNSFSTYVAFTGYNGGWSSETNLGGFNF